MLLVNFALMAIHETAFEELIVTEVTNFGIQDLDFASLPPEIAGILELTYSNPDERIKYLARNCLEELIMTGKFSWIGVVRTEFNNKPAIIIFPNSNPTIEIEKNERQNIRNTLRLLATVTDPIISIGMAYMNSPIGTEYAECVRIKVRSDFGMAELIWETDLDDTNH